ncbi:hypothetical protein OB08_15170 [Microbacterium sp. HJ5]
MATDAAHAASIAGTIAGTVVDESGAPVQGVEVVAHRYNAEWDYWEWTSSVSTGEDGTYWLPDLPAGEYKLQFTPTAWGSTHVAEWWDGAADEWSATPLTLEDGAVLEGISPVLAQGGSISGVVTDASGSAAESVSVVVFGADEWTPVGSATTDPWGSYAVGGLPAGEYRIQFQTDWAAQSLVAEWWDDAVDFASATPVDVAAGTETAGISPQLAAGNSVSGVVTDEAGESVPSVVAQVYSAESSMPVASGWTDEYGSYVVRGLPDGDYHVEFNAQHVDRPLASEWWDDAARQQEATLLSLSGGTQLSDISPVLGAAGAISGTVADEAGIPVTGASVSLYTFDADSGEAEWLTSTWVDGDGAFLLQGVRPGAYKIEVQTGSADVLGEWWRDATGAADAEDVIVAAGETTSGIDVRLSAAGHISGTVTDETGTPVGGVTVIAYGADGSGMATLSEENGRFRVGGLRTGAYTVQFATDPWTSQNVAGEWWDDALSIDDATAIDVVQGQTVDGIDAVLSIAGSISGTVVGADGAPLIDVEVHAYEADAETPAAGTFTDANGAFTARGLRAGEYRLLFRTWAEGGELHEWWSDAATRDSATTITVAKGEAVSNIDETLSESDGSVLETFNATISGRIVDEQGQPIPGVMMGIENADHPAGDPIWVGEDGTWSVSGLTAGRYRIYATATIDGQVVTRWWEDALDKESSDIIAVTRGEQRTGIDFVLRAPVPPRLDSATPEIEGPPRVGSVLSVDPGAWTADTEFSYQWFADGEPVDGATSQTFAPATGHVGKRLTVAVTGSLAGHASVTELSERSAPIKPEKVKKTTHLPVTAEPVPVAF